MLAITEYFIGVALIKVKILASVAAVWLQNVVYWGTKH
jgi:hypothetical protein